VTSEQESPVASGAQPSFQSSTPKTVSATSGAVNSFAPSPKRAVVIKPSLSFIHSSLDDLHLSPAEFRVYCHICRRAGDGGECYAAVPNMAKVCRLHVKTVRKCLHELTARNLFVATRRTGQTTRYKLRSPSEWQPHPKQNLPQSDTEVSKGAGTLSNRTLTHPAQTNAHKGSPSEGSPMKGSPADRISL
jgi:hypothetical protein